MATQSQTLVALEPLFIGRARAHNRGDRVPEDNVDRHGWRDLVAEATSSAGREALGLAAAGGDTPALSATKAVWVEHAVAIGAISAEDAEADALTKEQVIARVHEHETGVQTA